MTSVASQVDISKAVTIGGWMSVRELTWLATQAQNCSTIVEFGSFHGRSTRAFADNLPLAGRVWAVDPWNVNYPDKDGHDLPNVNTFVMPYFLSNLRDKIKDGTVIPVRGFSSNFSLPFTVDMVFLDGDHRYESVVKDLERANKLIKDGGIICGHDFGAVAWPGVEKAVREYFGNSFQIEDTIWHTRF